MLLRDLYRYRESEGRNPREAWLTACLAEVLTHDVSLRDRLLAEAGLALVGPVTVEHQPRLGRKAPDILLESDTARVFLECKDRDTPRLGQLDEYRRLDPKARVVLLAGAAAIAATVDRADPRWAPYPALSWERVHTLASEAAADPLAAWLRAGMVELLDWVGYTADLGPADVLGMLDLWERQEARRGQLRRVVAGLTPAAFEPDGEHWGEESLAAWWEVERDRHGLGLRGLGLEAEPTPRGSLSWSLDVRSATRGASAAALGKAGFQPYGEAWFRLDLFRGSPRGVWEEELRDAGKQAADALLALGVQARRPRRPRGDTPVAAAFDRSGRAAYVNSRIWGAQRILRDELGARVGRSTHTYAVVTRGGKDVGWFQVDTAEAGWLRLLLGWGLPKNTQRLPISRGWWEERGRARFPGVRFSAAEHDLSCFAVDLRLVPLREAIDRLAELGACIVAEAPDGLFT